VDRRSAGGRRIRQHVRNKTVLVRMPANPRELNQWTLKQVLDTGVERASITSGRSLAPSPLSIAAPSSGPAAET
jgi:hypothetical protein